MSGLEPLVALGLACNVFQVVSFAGEVCKVAKTIITTRDVPPPALAITLKSLMRAFRDAESTATGSGILTAQDKELVKVAKDCHATAEALRSELGKAGRRSSRAFVGARSRRKKLEKFKEMVKPGEISGDSQKTTNAEIYRQDAARYFNLALTDLIKIRSPDWRLQKLFQLGHLDTILLASDKELMEDILNDDGNSPALLRNVTSKLQTLRTRLEVRCAGLLEVGQLSNVWVVRFVHRSAAEFLLSTQGFERILKYDESTSEDRFSDNWAQSGTASAGQPATVSSRNGGGFVEPQMQKFICKHKDFNATLALNYCAEFLEESVKGFENKHLTPSPYAAYPFNYLLYV
ncbi:hypothetical protein OQA88_12473 [Cercophora sp. LCS_1]